MSELNPSGQGGGGHRAGLPDDVRTFIVQALACFDRPSEVAKAVKDEFGLVVSRQAVERYDPTKRAGTDLSVEHRAVFEATRSTFLQRTAEIGISHRSVRLRALERLVDRAEAMGNITLAAELLEQAAKEMGGAFTNKREVGGDRDGAPLKMVVTWAKPV